MARLAPDGRRGGQPAPAEDASKSRVTLAARLAGKTAAETISVMLAIFARIKPALRKSITFDKDTAFAQHGLLHSMRAMATWFCDAYASWQKGGVENANGRLRRWLPRHIDIDRLSDAEIQDIVITANLTPRKCLGFKTPFQAILKELGKDAQTGIPQMGPIRAQSWLPSASLASSGPVVIGERQTARLYRPHPALKNGDLFVIWTNVPREFVSNP